MRDLYVLYLALRDSRVTWPPKLIAALVVAYVLSPVDFLPDWLPFLGFLDDIAIVPLGIGLAMRFIPPAILAEHRFTAAGRFKVVRRWSRAGAILGVAVGLVAVAWLISLGVRHFRQ
ncbi:MAG TPA: YkvA family protein [Candidatus Udaeobacter sp.]|nr:YkvA family protein [Candidatus Udaeobacter sp.]